MPEIVLIDEQAKVVATALKPVTVRDGKGNTLGHFEPIWAEEDLAEARKALASGEPGRTTAQVLEHLRSLESK
jgi:hypothetical protein